MTSVSHKLQLHYSHFPNPINSKDDRRWVFDQWLENQQCDFFLPLLNQLTCIRLEFDVLQTQLGNLISTSDDIALHEDKLVTALMLAETLQYQYRHFLVSKSDTVYFQQQAEYLRRLLRHIEYIFPENELASSPLLPDTELSSVIHEQTNKFNPLRQALQRSRRFLLELDNIFHNSASRSSSVEKIDGIASPLIQYFCLFLYFPRALAYLGILAKHILPGSWMSERERQMNWHNRLSIQLKQRGFQLTEDLIWCMVNISICFILVGPLSHWTMSMVMFQLTSEVLSRVVKLLVEMQPLIELRNHYLNLLENCDSDSDKKEQIALYLTHLDKRIDYEIKKLKLSAANSATILLLLSVSMLTISPVIPPIATGLIVAATTIFYILNRELIKSKPDKQQTLTNLVKQHSFFSNNNEDLTDTMEPMKCKQTLG